MLPGLRRTVTEANEMATLENLLKAARNPATVRSAFDRLRWASRAGRFHNEIEVWRSRRPKLLSRLFSVRESRVRQYEDDLRSNKRFRREFERRWKEVYEEGGYGEPGVFSAETMYLVCRITEPEVVVETGVLFGLFDAHILLALRDNRSGELHCIDLPEQPDGVDHGYFIPEFLLDHWNLYLGEVEERLPSLLADLGGIDLFFHDSDHTPEHMAWEYELAFDRLSADGVLASHDVIVNRAFGRFVERNGLEAAVIGDTGLGVRPRDG